MADVLGLFTEDLRLALLALGSLFILGLLLWEFLQRRRARRADDAHEAGPLGQRRDSANVPDDPLFAPAQRREPVLSMPEISVRDRLVEPPLVDLDVAVSRDERGRSLPIVDAITISDDDLERLDVTRPPVANPSGESTNPEDDSSSGTLPEPIGHVESGTPGALRVDWPPENERRIVALRLIARQGERFTGVSLRQALQGEGFQHGEMQIFHRPVADGRALLSAASLTRPGGFDLETMDSNLFLGLNLFAVLPGPLGGRETVDKLLGVGHTLAQRLRGELRDARGEPLTEARLAELRREAARGEG